MVFGFTFNHIPASSRPLRLWIATWFGTEMLCRKELFCKS